MLGCLTTDEGAAGELAAGDDPADDLGDALGDHLTAGDVVLHEQRLGAAHDEVVDDHADQVDADRVVLVQGLRDRELGADTVGAAGQERTLPAVGVEAEEPSEAAETADDLGAAGAGEATLHQLDRAVTRVDVHARRGVGGLLHGRDSASSAPPPASNATLGSAGLCPSAA